MADIEFKCPNCQNSIVANEKIVGMTASCPHCKLGLRFQSRTSVVIAAAQPEEHPTVPMEGAPETGTTLINCPHCTAVLKIEQQTILSLKGEVDCPQCGKHFTAGAEKVAEPEPALLAQCPKCAYENIPILCPNCGKVESLRVRGSEVRCACGHRFPSVECPQCHANIYVPSMKATTNDSILQDVLNPSLNPSVIARFKNVMRNRREVGIVLVGCIAMGLFVIVCIMGYIHSKKTEAANAVVIAAKENYVGLAYELHVGIGAPKILWDENDWYYWLEASGCTNLDLARNRVSRLLDIEKHISPLDARTLFPMKYMVDEENFLLLWKSFLLIAKEQKKVDGYDCVGILIEQVQTLRKMKKLDW